MTPDRDRARVWAELDGVLSAPEFDPALRGVNATYGRLRAFGRVLGPARQVHRDPERMLAGMEWAGTVDPAVMHAAMVHYGVATTALVECGHPGDDLDPLLAELDALDAPGVIVATELGRGGSQVDPRTEARYDRTTGAFTLSTPDDAAVKVMPNVGWTGLPRTAVVTARLLVDGAAHGVHAFAVRFPHPRARVTSLPGGAPVPLDYAVIRFEDAEIPFGCWLSDTAAITDTGVEDPLPARQRLARSLGGVNAAVVSAAVALASAGRAAVAIAARYSARRLVGHPGVPAMSFATHRADLASALARTYATGCYVDKVRRDFIAERHADTRAAAPEGAEYAPWLAGNRDRTLAKVAATTALEAVGAACRRLCGSQGVLHANRITVYEDMARSFHAAGGDTRLLLLEAGRQLVAAPDAPSCPVLPGESLGDPAAALRLACLRERVLADRLRQHPDLAATARLAEVHIGRRILQEFDAALTACDPRRRAALGHARRLHGIDVLLDSASWHLNHGSLHPGDLDVLHQARDDAVDQVADQLPALVDGLAVPPGRAAAPIGRDDYVDRIAALVRRGTREQQATQ